MIDTDGTANRTRDSAELIRQIGQLPEDWHLAGMMNEAVLHAIVRHTRGLDIAASLETGSGKTTLLFSHLSRDHTVFAIEGDNRSITAVRESPLLNAATVTFVEGPTQLTLPRHAFPRKVQIALIDGPHGYPFPDLEYFYVYPLLDPGAVLIVDDIHIPTIHRLFEFLCEDEMFELLEVVRNSAFFRRTGAELFSPVGDGWWQQRFNTRRFPADAPRTVLGRLRRGVARRLPPALRDRIKRIVG